MTHCPNGSHGDWALALLPHDGWMMLVPRRAECFGEISLNGLAFLGALLVRSPSQLRQLITAGPMSALVATAS